MDIGLFGAVRVIHYGIATNTAQLFAILGFYSPTVGTFFTPDGKIELALHEM